MRAVEVVLEHQLPVAVVGVLEDTTRDLELTAGRAIDQIIERRLGRTEELLETRPIRGERAEDEATVDRDARQRLPPELCGRALRVARGEGHRLQRAGAVVAPAVIRTDEALGVAAALRAHHRAAMRAAVDE